jgi:hypothetical protein
VEVSDGQSGDLSEAGKRSLSTLSASQASCGYFQRGVHARLEARTPGIAVSRSVDIMSRRNYIICIQLRGELEHLAVRLSGVFACKTGGRRFD